MHGCQGSAHGGVGRQITSMESAVMHDAKNVLPADGMAVLAARLGA